MGKMTWFECQAACSSNSLSMLCVESAEENSFIYSNIKSEAWIGYSDAGAEGTWLWESGCSSSYENWGGDEPNSHGGDEDYAVICATYFDQWCDWGDGTENFQCICETTGVTLSYRNQS